MVSENTVVICDAEGIHLYHIPELGATGNPTLESVWEWRRKSRWMCGSVCMPFSQRPILYLEEASSDHTTIFRSDPSGRNLVVGEHRVCGGFTVYVATPEEGLNNRFMMKGRKVLRYTAWEGSSEFDTRVVGAEMLASGFDVQLELPDDNDWDEQEVRFVDFDERTGRMAISTNRRVPYNKREAIRIYLADVPA